MTIRQRTLLFTSLLLAGSLMLVFIIAHVIITRKIDPMDIRQVSERLKAITSLLQKNIRDMERWSIDWAMWDDSYEFMKSGSQKFISVDLNPSYFKAYDIENLLFLLPDGRVRYACTYDFAGMTRREMAPPLLEKLRQVAALGAARSQSEATVGMFRLGDTFYNVAAHAILPSSGKGIPRGMLVFANEVEKAEQKEIGETLSQPFTLMAVTNRRLSDGVREQIAQLPSSHPHMERIISDNEIEGFSLLSDLLTKEKIVVHVIASRPIAAQGNRIVSYFLWAILCSGIVIIASVMTLLNRTVLLPLKALSRSVADFDFSKPTSFIAEPEGEELNNLARTFNTALQTLNEFRREAERANAAKSRFLATMSHELRTPLSIIMGQTESMADQDLGTLNSLQMAALAEIAKNSGHLLSLINDILDLSKIEAGRMELFLESVNLEELCRSCVGSLAMFARSKEQELLLNLDRAPTYLRADLMRLRQILINLLHNALKFTPSGGTVGLEVAGDAVHNVVRFTVWDTGIGISEEHQQQLFVPFMQVDDSLSRRHEGTGLGLALVAHLACLHGGQAAVVSRSGEGSRFTVTIPWMPDATNAGETPAVPLALDATQSCHFGREALEERDAASDAGLPDSLLPEGEPATDSGLELPLIILAEDNTSAFEMVARYLKKTGYHVIRATTGEEALNLAGTAAPDLILMDVQMPGMNGLEAISRIRELPAPAGMVPIIALTALATPDDQKLSLKAGATAHVSKPVRLQRLADIMQKLLRTSSSAALQPPQGRVLSCDIEEYWRLFL